MDHVMMRSGFDFGNATELSISVIVAVIFISIELKAYDYKSVKGWLLKHVKWAPAKLLDGMFCVWLVSELCLASWILWAGFANRWLPVVLSTLLLIVSLLVTVVFKKSGGCPCFGTTSMVKEFNGFKICFSAFIFTIISSVFAPLMQAGTIFCLVLALLLSLVFLFGRHLAMEQSTGARSSYGLLKILASYNLGIATDNTVFFFFFLRKNCHGCIVLLKYVEKISMVFSENIKYVVVIDGFSADDVAKFGGAYVVPDKGDALKSEARVSSTPTLVAIHGNSQRKYVGLGACNAGLSNIICELISN
jgi:hypothetical protein